MKTIKLLLSIIIFMAYSCEKDDKSNNQLSKIPRAPASVNVDLNGDSLDDIKMEYRMFLWDGVNSSGEGVEGSIEPLNGNSVLQKQNDYSLFNTLGDTIRKNTTEPYYWQMNTSIRVVSISTREDFSLPDEWEIKSAMNLNYYYLGIRINTNGVDEIGWIKIKINKTNGDIHIVDKKFTTSERIVIKR